MKEYIQANKERFYEELFSLLRIPSISAKKENKEDMRRCAERLAVLLMEAGADEAGVYPFEKIRDIIAAILELAIKEDKGIVLLVPLSSLLCAYIKEETNE